MKIKLILAYNGSRYCGWQVQKNAVSIQETLQDSIETVFGERGCLTGCSRTDSGVHANTYCCCVSFDSDIPNIPQEKIPVVLNRFLPEDISVKEAEYVYGEFHPRYDVLYKEYEYLIWNSEIRDPFLKDRAYIYPKKLDAELMNSAAQNFIGEYDFCSFMSSGSSVEDTVRNIKYFNVTRDGDIVRINVAADGFLYNMVRILVGTLIEVSEGKIKPEEIESIIQSKNRKLAGFTVPACGLYLNKVVY